MTGAKQRFLLQIKDRFCGLAQNLRVRRCYNLHSKELAARTPTNLITARVHIHKRSHYSISLCSSKDNFVRGQTTVIEPCIPVPSQRLP